MSKIQQVTAKEAIQLGAVDSNFYARYFFPKTVRQPSPEFHKQMDLILEDPAVRFGSIEVFRGGAKTSKSRLYTSRRIAYGVSKTILFVGKSLSHAMRSVQWLQRAVEYNQPWAQAFSLRKGGKWSGEEISIINEASGDIITILALGMTGAIRGINIDDWRPDLIIGDDLTDEENSATPEQRQKTEDLWFGALKESLAPPVDSPHAKMILLGTPLDKDDLNEKCQNDPEFVSMRIGCWTPETEDLPVDQQVSRWEDRLPSRDLREQKKAAIQRNQLSLWMREKECKLVSRETSDFRKTWLKFWTIRPERMTVVYVIDPVPPPTERQIAKGLRDKDYEAHAIVGRVGDKIFLLDYRIKRGHNPEWTVNTMFELGLLWRPRKIKVESVAYQATLSWLLKRAMQERHMFFTIEDYTDKRAKRDRIVQGLNGPAANGMFYCREDHYEFIEAFERYPAVSHDDLIEAVAIGVEDLHMGYVIEGEAEEIEDDPELAEAFLLGSWRGAP